AAEDDLAGWTFDDVLVVAVGARVAVPVQQLDVLRDDLVAGDARLARGSGRPGVTLRAGRTDRAGRPGVALRPSRARVTLRTGRTRVTLRPGRTGRAERSRVALRPRRAGGSRRTGLVPVQGGLARRALRGRVDH